MKHFNLVTALLLTVAFSNPTFTVADSKPTNKPKTTQSTQELKENNAIQLAKNSEGILSQTSFQETHSPSPHGLARQSSKSRNPLLYKSGEKERASLHSYATEHNIEKKPFDLKERIPMESENLIHVTPHPLKKKNKKREKKTKNKKRPFESNRIDVTENPKKKKSLKNERKQQEKKKNGDLHHKKGQRVTSRSGNKPTKGKKYPKKYNAKKHILKKGQRKGGKNLKQEKNKKNRTEKITKKREMRAKKSKLHHSKD